MKSESLLRRFDWGWPDEVYLEGYWNGEAFGRVGPVELEVCGDVIRVNAALEVPTGSGELTAALVDADGRHLVDFPKPASAAPGDFISAPTVRIG